MAQIVSESASPLTLTLFGPMKVQVQGQEIPRLHSRKALWLLALLTLRHGRSVEREWLAGTLWPDADHEQAFANLRPVISHLRRTLGSESERLLSPSRRSLCLDLTAASIDVLEFDRQILTETLSDLAEAVALYTGPFLQGCTEEWVEPERNSRKQACLRALGVLANASLSAGDFGAASEYFRRAMALDPWQGAARRGLMEALAQGGDRNAALQAYRDFTTFLRSDPRAIPDEATNALYARLRKEVSQKAASSPPNPANMTAAPTVSGYLPHSQTELVGREKERLEVAAKLRRSRLVTLTGPGGIGKTRLSLEVAAEAAPDFADGVWLVPLEALTEGAQVAGQIAAVLGLKEEVGRSVLQTLTAHCHPKHLLLVLDNCEHLLESSAQIAGHVLRECAGVRILTTTREPLGITGETVWSVPALTVPSPAFLPAQDEISLQTLAAYESVTLFIERAQAVQKTFALTEENSRSVAQACFLLEGLPLAIELAATQVKTMRVDQIASRLHDCLRLLTGESRTARSRQQTLRATLDWSHELLGEPERVLLRRLSVFAGGGTLSVVEHACVGDGITKSQILDLLTSLLDKSMVVFEAPGHEALGSEARYRLLETVRQYAAERLHIAGEEVLVRTRHRDYFLAQAEESETQLYSASQGIWLMRLEADHANLRAALEWCGVEPGAAEAGLRLAGALGHFWEMHGYYTEGRASLAEALQWERAEGGSHGRAKALNVAGVLAFYQGDNREARRHHEEGLAISRELGDRKSAAWALNNLADVVSAEGDHEAAWTLYTESLTIFRELNHRQGIAQLLHHLGRIRRDQGDYTEAGRLYKEGLAIQQELGDRQGAAWALHHLGNLAGLQGDLSLARTLQEESLAIFQELGSKQGSAWALHELGKVANDQANAEMARSLYSDSLTIFRELGNKQGIAALLHQLGQNMYGQGDLVEAKNLYEECLSIQRELRNKQAVGWVLHDLGKIASDQGRFASARTFYAESLSLLMSMGDRRGVAVCLRELGAELSARGNLSGAVQVWGSAEALVETLSASQASQEHTKHDRHLAQARTSLGEDAFAAFWAAGRTLTWEQALADALDSAVEVF